MSAHTTQSTNHSADSLTLKLHVTDPETVRALVAVAERNRDEYAVSALKVGVIALNQAHGRLDQEFLQKESKLMVANLQTLLETNGASLLQRISGELSNYFHPSSGRFSERVERLVKRDGELESLLKRSVGDTPDSLLRQTLSDYLGPESPLMRVLDPKQSEGVLALITKTVEQSATLQRERLLSEFSLDNSNSALSRLINELDKSHGILIDNVKVLQQEFSLDSKHSALNKLIETITTQQDTLAREFSLDNSKSALARLEAILQESRLAIDTRLTLDNQGSPLSRLRSELMGVLSEQAKHNQAFQEQIAVSVGKLATARREQAKSTRGGILFEDAVFNFVNQASQQRMGGGDITTATGNSTGIIKNCKVGDVVVQLGPDSPAPGVRIVVEAKDARNYNLAKALEEIAIARQNRQAQIGIFVFSKRCLKSEGGDGERLEMDSFARYGDDLVVVWDSEDDQTDVYLSAALMTARALSIRSASGDDGRRGLVSEEDLKVIEKALLEIEKRASGLDEIVKYAQTVSNAAEKIMDRARLTRKGIDKELSNLNNVLAVAQKASPVQ